MVVGSLILLAAASFLASTGDGYERVGGNLGAEREARAALGQLTSDLSTARFHKNSMFQSSTAAWAGDEVGFLTLQPAEAQSDERRIGDLCAVHYYLADLPIGGKSVRCLMRGFRESADVFKAIENNNLSALFSADPDRDEPIAFGVVSFAARPKSWDNTARQWRDWTPDPAAPEIGPQALDIRLILARRQLAGRLKTAGDWNNHPQLGNAAEADRNPNLEIHGSLLRFGIHENQ
jgi:hypothetical protein